MGVKEGELQFREFARHFPLARVEDYFKNGRWLTELLELDMELIFVHRREAAAPEPPPLDAIPQVTYPDDFKQAMENTKTEPLDKLRRMKSMRDKKPERSTGRPIPFSLSPPRKRYLADEPEEHRLSIGARRGLGRRLTALARSRFGGRHGSPLPRRLREPREPREPPPSNAKTSERRSKMWPHLRRPPSPPLRRGAPQGAGDSLPRVAATSLKRSFLSTGDKLPDYKRLRSNTPGAETNGPRPRSLPLRPPLRPPSPPVGEVPREPARLQKAAATNSDVPHTHRMSSSPRATSSKGEDLRAPRAISKSVGVDTKDGNFQHGPRQQSATPKKAVRPRTPPRQPQTAPPKKAARPRTPPRQQQQQQQQQTAPPKKAARPRTPPRQIDGSSSQKPPVPPWRDGAPRPSSSKDYVQSSMTTSSTKVEMVAKPKLRSEPRSVLAPLSCKAPPPPPRVMGSGSYTGNAQVSRSPSTPSKPGCVAGSRYQTMPSAKPLASTPLSTAPPRPSSNTERYPVRPSTRPGSSLPPGRKAPIGYVK